jgi:hypothetical protein
MIQAEALWKSLRPSAAAKLVFIPPGSLLFCHARIEVVMEQIPND